MTDYTLAELRHREAEAREMLAEVEADIEREFGHSRKIAREHLADARADIAKAEKAKLSEYWMNKREGE